MVVAIAVTVANPLAARAQTRSATTSSAPADNAAPLYRQAVEKIDDIDRDADAPIDAKTKQFLFAQKPRLDLMRRAALMQTCDWPQPYELADTDLLGKLRTLASVGILQARYDLSRERPKEAVDDLIVVMALGRHAGRTPLMISKLVEVGIVASATEQLARVLPQLPREVTSTIPARLEALPDSATTSDVVIGEWNYARTLVATKKVPGWDSATIQAAKPFYDAVAKSAQLPPDKFAQAVDAAVADLPVGAAHNFVAIVAPAMKPVRVPIAMIEAKSAMLSTGALLLGGQTDAVKTSHDPFGDGPFGYRTTGIGFELTSKLTTRGSAVKLTFGPPADGAS